MGERDGAFTPGPWRAERQSDADYRIIYNDSGNWLAVVHADGEPSAAASDARLIAAAPELMIALERIVDLAKPGQSVNVSQATDIICDIWNEARAAIAAARTSQGGEG